MRSDFDRKWGILRDNVIFYVALCYRLKLIENIFYSPDDVLCRINNK